VAESGAVRAFVRDLWILVLDEPASALDAQAEFELFERLCEVVQDAGECLCWGA
jgi:ABC-type nitrate/sulfonate/bicarbonate transport system ATPase subunit